MKKTKIVCTIGPATNSYETLLELGAEGMNVARLNMSHGTHEWHADVIQKVKQINEEKNFAIAILLDTKGPELRSGDLDNPIIIGNGDILTFANSNLDESQNRVGISYPEFYKDVVVGDTILIESGLMSFVVKEINGEDVVCECIEGGELTSRRHVNIVGKSPSLDPITDKDREDIKFGVEHGVDFVAQSFVQNGDDVRQMREFLNSLGGEDIDIIAKVESASASRHLADIIKASDGAMVARGDLGAELSVEEVPIVQDKMIELCRSLNKPVIVATQMLESMMEKPTPTRAEVSDIANAVKAGTDAIMLSGETAAGKYPVKAVKTMATVAKRMEEIYDVDDVVSYSDEDEIDDEMAFSATYMANSLEADGIVVFTRGGTMGKLTSLARPDSSLFVFTDSTKIRRQLNIRWGLKPLEVEFRDNPEETVQFSLNKLKELEFVKPGARLVLVASLAVGGGFINSIQVRGV